MKDLLKYIPVPSEIHDSWMGCPLPPKFEEITAKQTEAWFVDGGNAAILEAPHFSLQKLRAVAVKFPEKEIKKIEETALLTKTDAGWLIRTERGTMIAETGEIGQAISTARQRIEHEIAKQCSGLVVLDGDNPAPNTISIQKSITVLTKNNFPLSSVLSKEGPWVAKINNMYAVKLDKRARHVFLVHNATKEQLEALMHYSQDSLFAGYPYGLVLADRLARVSKEEALSLRVHARSMMQELQSLKAAEAAIDSHSILDSMG